jgi:hypothetical protein
LRKGAEALVSVGGRIVVARQQVGRGRVVWSGMNLVAHDASAGSAVEDAFTAGLFQWLLAGANPAPQSDLRPLWTGDDQARLDLSASAGPVWVLFKESFAPGWSAQMSWPSSQGVAAGTASVPLVDGEMDLIVARLQSVPPGAHLTFTYGPTTFVYLSWLLSALSALGFGVWLIRPRWVTGLLKAVAVRFGSVWRRSPWSSRWDTEDG